MVRIARSIYVGAAWLFVAGVIAQVYLAGMVVVAGQISWENHIGLGHTLSAPLLVMLVTMYLGRMPASLKRLSWLLFAVYVLQADVVIFMRSQAPAVSALHPVFALADFALGLTLAWRASQLRIQLPASARVQPGLENVHEQ